MPYLGHIVDAQSCDEGAGRLGGQARFSTRGMAMGSWGTLAGLDRPFIGLRPFEYNDRDYFFGRDDELDALELHVRQNSFVSVVGRLGCGKSSLISAGLR